MKPANFASTIQTSLFWLALHLVGYWVQLPSRRFDPEDDQLLASQVDKGLYRYSALLMAACIGHTLLSLVWESTPTGRRAGVLCLCIQLMSAHTDYTIASGKAVVWQDFQGNPLLPLRFIHWGTCPSLMLVLFANVTKMTGFDTCLICLLHVSLVWCGFLSQMSNVFYTRALLACYCTIAFGFLFKVTKNAVAPTMSQKKSTLLVAFYWSSFIWSLFAAVFYSLQLGWLTLESAEVLLCVLNFFSKAFIASTLMFHNMLIAEKDQRAWLKSFSKKNSGLLHMILPRHVVTRIHAGEHLIADFHAEIGVLFTDIVGFTQLSSSLETSEIFVILNTLFSGFDALMDKYGVYKVETIGDAFMVVAGHDENVLTARLGKPVDRLIATAKDMLKITEEMILPAGNQLQIRIGIHCGPAYSGVVSMMRPRYCFLGDTVNTASRMESNSFPMAIHVSHQAMTLSSDAAQFHRLPTRFIKGKGLMMTYLVKVGKWEAASDAAKEMANIDLVNKLPQKTSSDIMQNVHEMQEANAGLQRQLEGVLSQIDTERRHTTL